MVQIILPITIDDWIPSGIITDMRKSGVTILLAFFAAVAMGADKKAVVPAGSATAGPYTPGILAGSTLFVSGQVGRDPKTGEIPANFEDEVRQTLANAGAVLKEAGYGFEDAVAVQVYLTDMSLFQRMNKVYMEIFPEPRPARTTVGVSALVGPAKIEITVTAWKKEAPKK